METSVWPNRRQRGHAGEGTRTGERVAKEDASGLAAKKPRVGGGECKKNGKPRTQASDGRLRGGTRAELRADGVPVHATGALEFPLSDATAVERAHPDEYAKDGACAKARAPDRFKRCYPAGAIGHRATRRARVYRQETPALAGRTEYQEHLHHPFESVGERLCGIVPLPLPRRMPQPGAA